MLVFFATAKYVLLPYVQPDQLVAVFTKEVKLTNGNLLVQNGQINVGGGTQIKNGNIDALLPPLLADILFEMSVIIILL